VAAEQAHGMNSALAKQDSLVQSERAQPASSPAPPKDVGDIHPRMLRCFVAVAEELHFSRAADRLFIPQPWLSRMVRPLERQAGVPLFVRSTRSVRLTPAGRRLLPEARDVLEALDAVGRLASARRAELRIPHVPGHDTAMLALDRLAASGTEFALEEFAIEDGEQIAAVGDGRIDVAVCRLPRRPRADLCRELVRLDPALVAIRRGGADPPDSIDLRRTRVAVAAGRGRHSIEQRLAGELERRIGRPLPRVPVAPGSGTEIGAFERAREPAFLTFESALFHDERYARVAVAPVQPHVAWWLVWRRDNVSPATRSFLDAARTVARERLWKTAAAVDGKPLVLGGAL
jgi:DNA-binding transcriptional LysR family regulator